MKRIHAALGLLALVFAAGWAGHAAVSDGCMPEAGFSFICGPASVEDLVQIPGTHWIVGSGMSENRRPGMLHLINAENKTWEILYPGANPKNEQDTQTFPSCAGAPDAGTFGAHGIAIRKDSNNISTLLAVNHGREAIEVFRLDAGRSKPVIRWVGCVPLDEHTSANSVAFLPGGGFVYTKFYDPKTGGFGAIMEHKITGGVFEWRPETGIRPIPGTELCGANGIVVSRDGKRIYVAAWGTQELVQFSLLESSPPAKKTVPTGFYPDNLRWAPDGTILVAGQNQGPGGKGGFPSFKGWTVGKMDPVTMQIKEIAKDSGPLPMQNASVAVEVDGMLWIGPYLGDRIAYKPVK